MSKQPTKTQIFERCEEFLRDWNRYDWMAENGEWTSAEWAGEREAYEQAAREFCELVGRKVETDGNYANRTPILDLREALDELEKAQEALSGQVRETDEDDYIAVGTIDPDCVADDAQDLDVRVTQQGWDCREGWSGHRVGDALYINWWRDAWGQRHERDLWVLVDDAYFARD